MKRLAPLPLTTTGKRPHIPNANAHPQKPNLSLPSGTLTNGGTNIDDDSSDMEGVKPDGKLAEEKKVKQKKPKVTVAEAAAKIDPADLSAYPAELNGEQPEIQMQKFAHFYGKAFQDVVAGQFPWMKMFRENTIIKFVDVPLSHISDVVYKTSADWISQQSLEAIGFFILWSLDIILEDLLTQQASSKGSKRGVQQISSKSKVGIFVALAMVLWRKPDALISVLPNLRENSKYQGQDKLPVIVWMILQASQGDLAVGLYLWSHHLLSITGGKNCNPQSRDLILQLVEWILSASKARTILVNGAVRKGERLDKVYLDNLKASVADLKGLSEEWREQTAKFVTLDPMREAIKSFTNKLLSYLFYKQTNTIRYQETMGASKGVVAFAAAAAVVSPNMNVQEWNKLYVVFSS
ncbi:hypothetical protein GQ457_03G026610 [Hibiscus cannabinus]